MSEPLHGRACRRCTHWAGAPHKREAEEYMTDDCRIAPPTGEFRGDNIWPRTRGDQWCGRFEGREVPLVPEFPEVAPAPAPITEDDMPF